VAKPFGVAIDCQRGGGKDERDRRRREQVRDGDRALDRNALLTSPWLVIGHGVVERDVVPGGIAGSSDGQGHEVTVLHHIVQTVELQYAAEQLLERLVV